MPSQIKFTPGKKSNTGRLINYVAAYNAIYPNSNETPCACVDEKYDKSVVGSDSPSTRISNNMRLSQILKYSKGGKTQYGNFYLGEPLNINYLGRMEGMSGGSGSPPSNF